MRRHLRIRGAVCAAMHPRLRLRNRGPGPAATRIRCARIGRWGRCSGMAIAARKFLGPQGWTARPAIAFRNKCAASAKVAVGDNLIISAHGTGISLRTWRMAKAGATPAGGVMAPSSTVRQRAYGLRPRLYQSGEVSKGGSYFQMWRCDASIKPV